MAVRLTPTAGHDLDRCLQACSSLSFIGRTIMGRLRSSRSRMTDGDGDGISSSTTSSSIRRRRASKASGWREWVTFENVCAIAAPLITIMIPIWLSVTTPTGPVIDLEVRPSTIPGAGLGVFLAKGSSPIPRGTVLTKFGDRLMDYAKIANTPLDAYGLRDSSNPKMTRVGRPWTEAGPVKNEEPVGHMCNDAAALFPQLPDGGWPSVEQLGGLVEKYEKESLAQANVRLLGDRSWNIVANQQLMPGDELFYSYGHHYWLADTMRRNPDPLARLLVYLYLGMKSPSSLTGATVILHKDTHEPVMSDTGEAPSEEWCESFNTRALLLPADDEAALSRFGLSKDMSQYERLVGLSRLAYQGSTGQGDDGAMDEL